MFLWDLTSLRYKSLISCIAMVASCIGFCSLRDIFLQSILVAIGFDYSRSKPLVTSLCFQVNRESHFVNCASWLVGRLRWLSALSFLVARQEPLASYVARHATWTMVMVFGVPGHAYRPSSIRESPCWLKCRRAAGGSGSPFPQWQSTRSGILHEHDSPKEISDVREGRAQW